MDFGHLLVERGLITAQELDEVLAVQRRFIVEGREPVPRLGEILISRGKLSETQVADVLAAQNKRILECPACEVKVNVDQRADVAGYRCVKCGGELQPPPEGSDVRVVDTSVILIAKEPVPPEVQAAMEDPARKLGKYILLEEIGRGGWAIVHRAWDTYLHQFVALKFLKPPAKPPRPDGRTKHDTRRIHDLLLEARAAIKLRHPHIVTVYDVGRLDKQFYIAMDCLTGRTLASLMKEARDAGKVSAFYDDPRRFVAAIRDVARAVHYAHTRQVPVIHCDLKPSNIFLDARGKATVLDFGLARQAADPAEERAIRGTPAYMAPEQLGGPSGAIDARTDVYGLGAVLYELLTGKPPFSGDLLELLQTSAALHPVAPSEAVRGMAVTVPPVMERICLRALERSRESRYASARELADDLDRFLGTDGSSRRRATTRRTTTHVVGEHGHPTTRRPGGAGRLMLYASAILSLLAVLGAVAALGSRGAGRPGDLSKLQSRLDDHAARLDLDLARQGIRDVGSVESDPGRRQWLDRQLEGLEWIKTLKGRLIEAINGKARYRAASFRLRDRELKTVEIVHANEQRLVAVTFEGTKEVPWGAVHPGQLADLARGVLGMNASDRMGLAVYCLKTSQYPEARQLLESLAGTDLEIPSKSYLKDLSPQ